MISIIICCRKSFVEQKLATNIENTIGVEHEIISIDNSNNQYNIFQAYNVGVKRARYPILCFMHDDVLFHTQDWGGKVIAHFNDSSIGMIGVAGPTYISCMPGIWWGINNQKEPTYSTRQYNIDTDRNNRNNHHTTYNNPYNESYAEVVVLDGLFFCIRKELFNTISFDESFGGFHFYDMDISMQVKKQGYRLLCIYNVLLEHISTSNLSKAWIDASRKFFSKWEKELPVSSFSFPKQTIKVMEENNLQRMIRILSANHISIFNYYTLQELLYIFFHFKHFWWNKLKKRLC